MRTGTGGFALFSRHFLSIDARNRRLTVQDRAKRVGDRYNASRFEA
jgi:hypothetical protein